MCSLEVVKGKLKRKATKMQIGTSGISNNIHDSLFGKVLLCLPGESWPETEGKPMHALCQINLTQLPYVPEILSDLEFITVFVGPESYPNKDANGVNWCLRSYKKLSNLVPLEQITTDSEIKPFQLKPLLVEEDYPSWNDYLNLKDRDNDLELTAHIEENYSDYLNNISGFKIGGWPTLIQSEILWNHDKTDSIDLSFAFQVDSTVKGNWMWGDNGIGYFGRSTKAGQEDQWTIEWQCL